MRWFGSLCGLLLAVAVADARVDRKLEYCVSNGVRVPCPESGSTGGASTRGGYDAEAEAARELERWRALEAMREKWEEELADLREYERRLADQQLAGRSLAIELEAFRRHMGQARLAAAAGPGALFQPIARRPAAAEQLAAAAELRRQLPAILDGGAKLIGPAGGIGSDDLAELAAMAGGGFDGRAGRPAPVAGAAGPPAATILRELPGLRLDLALATVAEADAGQRVREVEQKLRAEQADIGQLEQELREKGWRRQLKELLPIPTAPLKGGLAGAVPPEVVAAGVELAKREQALQRLQVEQHEQIEKAAAARRQVEEKAARIRERAAKVKRILGIEGGAP